MAALLEAVAARHLDRVPIRTKRWSDPPEPEDGHRLLVCRYRPRGVTREDEPWDAWNQAGLCAVVATGLRD